MRIDLHTHSVVSDGTQTPTELVHAARAAGLDVVALTDHDTAAGWDEATVAAHDAGISLVRGMEISTIHHGRGVHLLAYLPDPTEPALAAELARVVEGRGSRAPAMLAALARHGVDIDPHEIVAEVPGRPHVADAMVRRGYVASRDEAFADWLNPGRPAYVDRYATPLTTAIRLVSGAGGVTVVAHPWGRGRRDTITAAELERLVRIGLSGIEVDHQDHDADARAELRGIARDLDLVATGSSDHHGLGKVDHGLGVNTTDPEQYERLLERAAASAGASERTTPEVITP